MKKKILSMLLVTSCFGVANAQLMVDENGKVGFGIETEGTLHSKLTLNSLGRVDSEVFVTSQNTNTLYVKRGEPTSSSFLTTGITCLSSAVQNSSNAAIYASTSGNAGTGCSIGLLGSSASTSSQCNAGVMGFLLTGTNVKGAAVLGNSVNASLAISPGGRYAGFFYGDARVTGTMTAGAVVTSSDYRLKKNIRSLSSSDDCLDKILGLNVVEFNNIQREFETDGTELTLTDSTEAVLQANDDNKVNWYEDDSPIVNNKHYGLIAQELQKIYPDLVVESQDGYLAINYLEIIPLLIRSVQELKAELDASKNGNAPVQKAQARNTDVANIDAVVTALYQNTPNPFTESTLIRCDVADDVVKADLYIYSMNGEQIAEYAVTERGETSITIDGGSLNAGMYLYALIADGQVIDTKRMILTK